MSVPLAFRVTADGEPEWLTADKLASIATSGEGWCPPGSYFTVTVQDTVYHVAVVRPLSSPCCAPDPFLKQLLDKKFEEECAALPALAAARAQASRKDSTTSDHDAYFRACGELRKTAEAARWKAPRHRHDVDAAKLRHKEWVEADRTSQSYMQFLVDVERPFNLSYMMGTAYFFGDQCERWKFGDSVRRNRQ